MTKSSSIQPSAALGLPESAVHAEPTAAETIGAQLARAGTRLRFDDSRLEQDFRRFLEIHSLFQVRCSLVVLMVLVGLFGLTDLMNFPLEVAQRTLALRLALVVFLVWTFWCTYRLREGSLHPRYLAAAVASGLGGVALVYLPHSTGLHTPYEGLMLFMIGIGCFMGLRFGYAVCVLVLVAVMYVVAELAAGMPRDFLVNSAFRLVSAGIVAGFGGYLLERQTRVVYLHRSLLAGYAHRDGLTGIANKRAFDEHAERAAQQAAREGKPISVMMVDADHFKEFNDTYGHLAGDAGLKSLAGALEQSARRPFDLAARCGGEEFVLFFFDVDADEALRLSADLQARVERLALPHAGSPVSDRLTLSGGIATRLAGDLTPVETLLHQADQALYQAKAGGRNRFVHAGVSRTEIRRA